MFDEKTLQEVSALYNSVLGLESMEECAAFFTDLCTVAELKSMAQRLEVARLLKEGCTYTDISKQTGASAATISRVNKSLGYGEGGYTSVLARLVHMDQSQSEDRK